MFINFIFSRESSQTNSATKVFLSIDFVGQMHFCYLIPSRSQLSIARLEVTNNLQLIIGVVKSFRAKDAIAIPVS